jgi:hypothetical protein
MRKKVEKEKEKEIFSLLDWGEGFLAHPGRERARGRAYGPAAAHERGETARVREDDGVSAGPLVSESGGGGGNGVAARRRGRIGRAREKGRSPVGSTAVCRRWPGSRSKGGWFSTGRGWRF